MITSTDSVQATVRPSPSFGRSGSTHFAQFYDGEDFLNVSVSSFVAAGLENAEGVIIIATEEHRQALVERLLVNGFDVPGAEKSGQLTLLDADATLDLFMVDSEPNRDLFFEVVGGLIDKVLSAYPVLRAYGEMVNLLWHRDNVEATIALEELWNELLERRSFSLLCGYAVDELKEVSHGVKFKDVCRCHSHIVPPGTYAALRSDDPHMRLISELQQKTIALQLEVADRRTMEGELRLAKDAAAEKARALETLYRIGTSICSEMDLHKIVQFATDEATKLTGADIGTFLHCSCGDDTAPYTLYALSGLPREVFERIPVPQKTTLFGPRFDGAGVVRLADVTADDRFALQAPHYAVSSGYLPVKSYLAVPVISRSGEIIGALVTGHKNAGVFTERHERLLSGIAAQAAVAIDNARLYQELLEAREAADAANRAKSEFLANMSHEIRTPLGAIVGFAELMQEENQSPSDRYECLTTIHRNGQHLKDLVDDILDLSKVEAGKLELDCQKISLPDVIAEIRLLFKPQAKEKGLSYEFAADGPLPRQVTSDAGRLRQILVNLIGNAIKFTDRGTVSLAAKYVAPESGMGRAQIEFRVKDTGCGMTGEQIEKLFQPFSQADASTTRKYGGTGLGLALSRKLARGLGGDLVIEEAVPGRGCTFKVSIDAGSVEGVEFVTALKDVPAAVGAGSSGSSDTADRLAGVRVLVVDDTPDNQKLVSRILRNVGAEVEFAGDGAAGVEKALAGHFDVVLMDVQMPVLDGYDATSRLRGSGYRGAVVALTAHAMKEERDRCLAAGCDDHLTKPISRVRLIEMVASLSGVNGSNKEDAWLENDPDISDILQMFVTDVLPGSIAELDAALAERDWPQIAAIGHRLKGSAGFYVFRSLPALAGRIEAEARGARRPDEVARYIKELHGLKDGPPTGGMKRMALSSVHQQRAETHARN